MMVGARIIAPEGYKQFETGETYHLLRSDSHGHRVRLIWFINQDKDVSAELLTISRLEFEEALASGLLVENGRDDYPPWLEPIQNQSIPFLESQRSSPKEKYEQKVDRRYLVISNLVSRLDEVLESDNPNLLINAHAKSYRPKQNAGRVRLWFYSYIVFGFNKWALLPRFHRIGQWDREPSTKKLGRPSPKGRKHGYPCTAEMKAQILSGFLKCKGYYRTQEKIYRAVVTQEFGCAVGKDARHFYHPEGKPFPSASQFKYWLRKMISPDALTRELKGAKKARAESGSVGSFSSRLMNLNQRVEFDGYYITEKLSGVTEGSAVESFCVVRAVCGLSGMVVGIGFAEGRESMDAYRMALFSMATDKVKFCELFGMPIKPEEWPCIGVSGGIVFDRGPGATYDVEPEIHWLGSIELTPTYSGQSKATVESSHPRDKADLEQPTHFHSKLNFVQMARRELMQVLKDNSSSDASGRMTEEMFLSGFIPTPLNIWTYLDSRARNSSIGIPYEEAIRTFLVKHPVTIHKDAVYFYGRRYRSKELVETNVFDRVARGGSIKTEAYVLTMCVRHIWLELEGVIYELSYMRTVRTLDVDIDISLSDLIKIDLMRRQVANELAHQRPAIHQHFEDRFKNETGEDWDGGQRKLGRASKGGAAQRDTADYKRFIGKAK